MKNGKRILEIKIKKILDDSPDTSHMGEYGNSATSQFSIDRMHAEDCQSVEANHRTAVDKLERIITYLSGLRTTAEVAGNPDSTEWEELDESIDALIALQDQCIECDCGGHNCSTREYRYFNPSFNYVTKQDKPADSLTPDEVRKYVRQDYERMESLNSGNWYYLGIRAEAQIALPSARIPNSSTIQHITSGGLWGIESDSDKSYFKSVASEELADLKEQLKELGFSSRAISTAFKSVSEETE